MRDTRATLSGAVAILRALARGEEGFPGDAGGIVDPRLFGLGVATRRLSLLDDGAPGAAQTRTVTTRDGVAFSVGAFTVRGGKVVALDILADPERLRSLDLTILGA